MTDNHDKLRALVRRRNAAPNAGVLETEVRSQGAPNFKAEGSSELQGKIPTVAFWEWNYGVPQSDIEEFIDDLRDDEKELITLIEEILPEGSRLIEYRGTFISATGERAWYECRTVWSYRGQNPIALWVDLLDNSQFRVIFRRIRRRCAKDPGATERLMSLLQFYEYDTDFVDAGDDATAAGQRALMNASAGLSTD